ncbi:MAG: phosphoribosylanthranilate isomerase [Dehalococcoidia bacterium]
MTLVKICGIREPRHAVAAADAGADFVGVIFAPSPRRVTAEEAQAIARALGSTQATVEAPPADTLADARWFRQCARSIEALLGRKRPLLVGVFADAEPATINVIAESCGLDLVQLSGHEAWQVCLEITRPVIKAVRVGASASTRSILATMRAGTAALCLLDSEVKGMLGGSGQTFDWQVARGVAARRPVILAGGLTPENVGEAVRLVRPWAVDVSSGVETHGLKDTAKIRAFIAAAKEQGSP